MYENTQKTQQNQGIFHNLQLHLVWQYIKMCILIRHTFCENIFFSDIGQYFWLAHRKLPKNSKIKDCLSGASNVEYMIKILKDSVLVIWKSTPDSLLSQKFWSCRSLSNDIGIKIY